jgi:hypothetical protein
MLLTDSVVYKGNTSYKLRFHGLLANAFRRQKGKDESV